MKALKPHLRTLLLLIALLLSASAQAKIALPANLTVIETEAFAGMPIDSLVIPEGVERIESRAFADCGLKNITLPGSLTYIASDAFDGCRGLYATAPSGSYAARRCKAIGISTNNVVSLNVTSRTQEEIRSFIQCHPADTNSCTSFRVAPAGGCYSCGDYSPGFLSDATIENAINMINQFRYIAGLNADVFNAPYLEEMMGAASLVHGLNGRTSHYPSRPDALEGDGYDELFDLACTAAGSSNLSSGYRNLADSIYRGYMYDSSSSNIAMLGHRRWILNPSMSRTAFGYYEQPGTYSRYFSGMYAFDRSGKGRQNLVAWPAQQTPISHFYSSATCAWSLSFGRTLKAGSIEVAVTRRSDGRVWQFNSESADGAFYVDNGYYGQTGCVIFRPDSIGTICAGEIFDVCVLDESEHLAVNYTVEFF